MAVSYKRCKSGGCTPPAAGATVPIPGRPKGPGNTVYQCISATGAPCPTKGGSCDCFVVATQHGPNGAVDDDILDEKFYPAAPDPAKKDPYGGMLTVAKAAKDHSPSTRPAGVKRPTWWNITCTCLDTVGGEPAVALRVIITVPGRGQTATLRELRQAYGRKNVELLPEPTAAATPARRRAK